MQKIKIYCDGGSRGNPGPAACAFVVVDESENIIFQQGVFLGVVTNNQAEYYGVIHALNWLLGQPEIVIKFETFILDSQLIVNQINGSFKINDENLRVRHRQVIELLKQLNISNKSFTLVRREHNSRADALVNITLDSQ